MLRLDFFFFFFFVCVDCYASCLARGARRQVPQLGESGVWGVGCLDQIYWSAVLFRKRWFSPFFFLMIQIKALLPNELLASRPRKRRKTQASVQGGEIEFRGREREKKELTARK